MGRKFNVLSAKTTMLLLFGHGVRAPAFQSSHTWQSARPNARTKAVIIGVALELTANSARQKPLFFSETPKAQDSEQVENESETNR
jgi:hypothetical protein